LKRFGLAVFVGGGLGLVGIAMAAGVDAPRLISRAQKERGAYGRAVRLADEIGARLAGTPAAERAVTWAVAEMKAAGLENVHTEPVTVEAWARGAEDRVALVAPFARPLRALALGRSIGTPPAGLEAEVVEVDSFEALEKLGDRVRGKIVFFDRAITRDRSFAQYGKVGELRFEGAVHAARLGAIGAVVRSIGTGSHRLPHTGATSYDEAVPKIPFAALAAEDAELLHRALARGGARLSMHLGCGMRGPVQSANVIGELRGRTSSDELVLIGAHLDSWDVGDGALDDGAGVGIVVETARLLKDARPRRTVRVVLFMNEEYGLSGAKAYATRHAAELGKHVAAIEADAGAGTPYGFGVAGGEPARALVAKLVAPLAALGSAEVVSADHGGADLIPLRPAGVPTIGMRQDGSDYFEWHHTDGDTADKIDPDQIGKASAAFTVLVAALADSEEKLPRLPPPLPSAKR
jgi:Iap family predicted aminopeptidase